MGLLGPYPLGVKPMSIHSGKRIDRERIEIERSPDK